MTMNTKLFAFFIAFALTFGAASSVSAQYAASLQSVPFNFSVSNDGNKAAAVGNTVTSTISTTQTEGSNQRLVRLYVDRITNSSGQNVLNTANGITYTAPNPIIPITSHQASQQIPFTIPATTPVGEYTVTIRAVSDPGAYTLSGTCISSADDTFLDGVIYYAMDCMSYQYLGNFTRRVYNTSGNYFTPKTNRPAAATDATTRTKEYCDLQDDNTINQSDTVAVLGKLYVVGYDAFIELIQPPNSSFQFSTAYWACGKDLNSAKNNYEVVKMYDSQFTFNKYAVVLYGQPGAVVERTTTFKIKVGTDLAAVSPSSTDDSVVSAPTLASTVTDGSGKTTISLNTFVKNLGGAFTDKSFAIKLQKKPYGSPDSAYVFTPGETVISGGLQNNQILTKVLSYTFTSTDTNADGYEFRYVIDTDNTVPEYNETNNYSASLRAFYTPATSPFDFSLTNGGNKIIKAGDDAQNTITAQLVAAPTEQIQLSVDSITNESGSSFLNTSNGFTYSFSNDTPLPTETVTLSALSKTTTPSGTYTVTVSGTANHVADCQTSTVAAGVPAWRTTISCVYRSQTYTASVDSASATTITSKADDLIRTEICTAGANPSWQWVKPLQYNGTVGAGSFVCTNDLAGALKKTTTYTITVDPYNLIAEKGADVCSPTDTYIRLTWNRDPNAGAYRIYKQNGSDPETIVAAPQPVSGTSVVYYDPDANVSNSTGLIAGDLYRYQVAAVVNGVVQSRSAARYAFPSSVISCAVPFDYTVGSADITLTRGTTATFKVPVTLVSGTTVGATFQITPANAAITFTAPTSCSALSCVTTIGVTAGSAAPLGATTFTITGRTSTNVVRTNTITIRVTDNKAPYPVSSASLIGPCAGNAVINKSATLSFVAPVPADPENDFVTYEYQRDDGTGYGASITLPANVTGTNLTWSSSGAKKVRVRGVDSKGSPSPWVERSITVVATCPVTDSLQASCISGFDPASNQARWGASVQNGKAPYTYSWNGKAFSNVDIYTVLIPNSGDTAAAPTLVVKDAANTQVSADPICTSVTHPNADITLGISGINVTLKRGTSVDTTITVRSTNIPMQSDIANVEIGTFFNTNTGNASTLVAPSTNAYICSALIPSCTKTITISTATNAQLGTYNVPLKAISRAGDEFTGTMTVTVVNTPVTNTILNTSSGPATCTSSSIIARWTVDANASGYNIYRWTTDSTNKVRLNSNGPIAQGPAGTNITYTDTEVLPGDNYFYEVRSIVGGVEALPSPFASRTAPSPDPSACSFSFAVAGNGISLRPGEKVTTQVRVKLVSGASRPSTISLKPITRTVGNQTSEPYITAAISGSARCATITCTLSVVIEASPSASLDEYFVPVEARTDQGDVDTGNILVTIADIPYTPPTVNNSVFLQAKQGPTSCTPISASVSLEWPTILGQSNGYNVYRWEPSVGIKQRLNVNAVLPIAGDTIAVFNDKTAVQNTTYSYEVRGIINGKEQTVSPSATIATPIITNCAFNFSVSGKDISIQPGNEVTTTAQIELLAGLSRVTTLELGTPTFNSSVATANGSTGLQALIQSFKTGVAQAADGITAKAVDSAQCDTIPCTVKIQITSSTNTTQGAYTIPLTAKTVSGDITKGTLTVIVSKSIKGGCTSNCGGNVSFTLGATANPVTIIAGQTGSSQVSVYTVSPAGQDRRSSVTLSTPISVSTDRPAQSITASPTDYICSHSSPTCVQFIQITTDANTTIGEYYIPVLAQADTNETAQIRIPVTITADVSSDALPTIEMRAYLPAQRTPTAWASNSVVNPRRSSNFAPVTLDIEARRTLAAGSLEDFSGCYSTVEYKTANWKQGDKDHLVSPSLVFDRKRVTVIGAELFKISCYNTKTDRFIDAALYVNPVNDPLIIEF